MSTLAALAALAATLAHPMGNFSVNQYHEIVLRPDRVEVLAVVDSAEIPTLAARPSVDADGDGVVSAGERAAHAEVVCADVAAALTVRAGTQTLLWTVTGGSLGYAPGAGGLDVSRLECTLVAGADLSRAVGVTVENGYLADQIGWREMTATADGVRLASSPLPATSVTDRLRSYADDLLASVLDVRSAVLQVEPGTGVSAAAPATPGQVDMVTRLVATADRRLQSLVSGRLTPGVAVLALLLAAALGAAHAALPGHGKTVIAAYLAGTRGRRRDALLVGATVTAAHTFAVLVIGGLLAAGSAVVDGTLLRALSLASAALVVAVGVGMLLGILRRRPHGHDDHEHHHHHHDHHDHDHHHHDRAHTVHSRRWGLAGIGLAGGLVPSPSALIVLLAAVGVGHALFGVVLVVVYGLGMAATLAGAGLLLVAAQQRLRTRAWPARLVRFVGRGTAALPALTAAVVVLVGFGLAVRAVGGAL